MQRGSDFSWVKVGMLSISDKVLGFGDGVLRDKFSPISSVNISYLQVVSWV